MLIYIYLALAFICITIMSGIDKKVDDSYVARDYKLVFGGLALGLLIASLLAQLL